MTLTLLYDVVAKLAPVESNETLSILPGPLYVKTSCPELIFQKWTTPSLPEVVKIFSFLGDTAILFTRSLCSSSVYTHSPLLVFQIRTVPSNDDEIRPLCLESLSLISKNYIRELNWADQADLCCGPCRIQAALPFLPPK